MKKFIHSLTFFVHLQIPTCNLQFTFQFNLLLIIQATELPNIQEVK